MSSRRHFLSASVAAVSGLAFPRSLWALSSQDVFSNAALGAYQQNQMTPEHFESLIGSEFTVFLSDFTYSRIRLLGVDVLKLKTAEELAMQRRNQRIEPAGADLSANRAPLQPLTFTLRFAVEGQAFPQDTYLLDHGTLGRVSMFLVPSATGRCTATFSSFVTSQTGPARRSATMMQ